MIVISLYDRAAEWYRPAAAINTRGEAIRGLRDEANNPQSEIGKHPTDYELWQVGEFDHLTGELKPKKELLARAEDLLNAGA